VRAQSRARNTGKESNTAKNQGYPKYMFSFELSFEIIKPCVEWNTENENDKNE